MVATLRHRGPDGTGAQAVDGCALGHTRLSVIDLISGDQPMHDPSGRYTITFNGEIYNYEDIRAELEAQGVSFRTTSDTEVILAAYAAWGSAALDRFRGMFAFAIWDERDRTLFAARDLFGEKPLYFASSGGVLVLGSEIKALLASGLVSDALDRVSIDAYMALGYVPPTRCVYADIRPLPPAHFLRWQDGRLVVERYWTPRVGSRHLTVDEAAEQLRELLSRAVRRQLVADVPVGAFLSGGLDSTTIVALAQQHSTGKLRTFCVGFGDINELPYARAVARAFGTDHHEVDLGHPDVGGMLERMAGVYDEPFADSSCVPTYLLAQFARRHVKVVLSGDGGDEMFGGYGWYQQLAMSEHLTGTRAEWLLLRGLSVMLRDRVRGLHQRSVAAGLAARSRDMWLRAANNQVYLSPARRRQLWGGMGSTAPLYDVGAGDVPGESVRGLDRAFYFDVTTYLPGDILVKVDRAAMAHGLETRAPFLDRDVAEFALSLPPSLKATAHESKIVLRRAFEHVWPEEVRRRAKQGFGAPYARWLARPDVQALTRRIFRRGGDLRSLLPGLPDRCDARTFETWLLLLLGLWLEHRAARQ
jgi:asparagine synthase (glutamine-hydrolysing)